MKRTLTTTLTIFCCSVQLLAQSSLSKTPPPAAGLSALRESDIKADLYKMADDHFRGREAGTLDELKVSMWLADQAKAAGLQPAGDDGTYFQFFSMWRNRIAASSSILINHESVKPWKDALIQFTAPAIVNAPILYIERGDTNRADIQGKAIALLASPEGLNLSVSIPQRRYPTIVARRYANSLIEKGAVAVILIADDLAESAWDLNASYADHGTYDVEGGPNVDIAPKQPVIWLHGSQLEKIKKPGLTLQANINIEHFEYPSVNIVGVIPGKDARLSKEYVLYSGHQDHDGIRHVPGIDSIYNGADDNASVSVALLAIARAFHAAPGKRSALFVWHGAEERGLLGSKWYAAHPTVPKSSIVAVLNGDMIGRNSPDSAVLMGMQAPHRNSSSLVSTALAANQEGPKFLLDTAYDKVTHPEGWYFRSDHLPYARAGIPAVFYSSLLHPDYHTPRDEPKTIDTKKVTRIAEWMYRTGWKLAVAADRPSVDPGFRLER